VREAITAMTTAMCDNERHVRFVFKRSCWVNSLERDENDVPAHRIDARPAVDDPEMVGGRRPSAHEMKRITAGPRMQGFAITVCRSPHVHATATPRYVPGLDAMCVRMVHRAMSVAMATCVGQ